MTTLTVNVATINVPAKVGLTDWRKCYDEATSRGTDFTGANEIGSPRQKAMWLRRTRAKHLSQYGTLLSPNPIVRDPARWARGASEVIRLHGRGTSRLALRYPGFNGARYATVTVNECLDALDAPEVAVIQTHLVPRGRKVPEAWREEVRAKSVRTLTREVRAHRAAGRIVVLMGDFNMPKAPAIPGITWVWDSGVDKIGIAVPDGVALAEARARTFRAPTDHRHGVAALLRFTY